MRNITANLLGSRNGATFIGYGLIVCLIALVAIAIATSVEPSVGGFDETGTATTDNHSVA
jgi:Flp pilus assembly pilin Flp